MIAKSLIADNKGSSSSSEVFDAAPNRPGNSSKKCGTVLPLIRHASALKVRVISRFLAL